MSRTVRNFFIAWVVGLLAAGESLAQVWSEDGADITCQILDNPAKPVYQCGLTIIPDSRLEGFGSSESVELDADWYFAYIHLADRGYGDIDLNLHFQGSFWFDSTDLRLPDQLAQLALDAGWTWRSDNGLGFQFRVMPGLYSDLEEISSDAFGMPFSFAVVHAFDPSFSAVVGAAIRPSFDRVVMPLLGVAWEVDESVRLEVGVPSGRATWFASPDWSLHAAYEWQDATYALRDSDSLMREAISFEDVRAYIGGTYKFTDELDFVGELGRVFDRTVAFKDGIEADLGNVDIEAATFVRFAVVGPF